MSIFELAYGRNHGPRLQADGGDTGGGGDTSGTSDSAKDDATKAKDDAKGDPTDDDADLGDNGKETLRKERKARKDAEARLKQLEDAEAERERERQKQADEEAKKKGDFEKLAEKREQERNAAQSEAKTATERFDALSTAVGDFLKSEWDALPEETRDLYMADDDDVIAKFTFITKAKAAAAKKSGDKGKDEKKPPRGNGADPKATGGNTDTDDKARMAQRRTTLRNF